MCGGAVLEPVIDRILASAFFHCLGSDVWHGGSDIGEYIRNRFGTENLRGYVDRPELLKQRSQEFIF